jgi:glycosyltransferase involved in cell wall biosynthesis
VKSNNYFLINSLSGGGAERQVSLLVKHLKIHKLVCIFNVQQYEVADDKKVFLYPKLNRFGAMRFLLIPSILYKIKKTIHPNKHDHFISFLQLSNIIGLCCKLIWGCKLTVCIRTTTSVYYSAYNIGAFTKILDKLVLKYADKVLTNSEGAKIDLIEYFSINQEKIEVIYNGYDISQIEALKIIPIKDDLLNKLFNEYKVILSIGRLSEEKGLEQAIKIYQNVKNNIPQIKYVIIGDGSEKVKLILLAKRFGLNVLDVDKNKQGLVSDYDIYFLGFQKNPYQYYYRAKLFIFPSFFEGMPNTLIEAFICGAICIASDCKSGPREILSNKKYDDPITYPHFEFGYLMPVLKKSTLENELTAEEKIWVTLISSICTGEFENNLIINKMKVEKFALNNVINQWNKVI